MKACELIAELEGYSGDVEVLIGTPQPSSSGGGFVERPITRINSSHGLITPEDMSIILIGGAEQ